MGGIFGTAYHLQLGELVGFGGSSRSFFGRREDGCCSNGKEWCA